MERSLGRWQSSPQPPPKPGCTNTPSLASNSPIPSPHSPIPARGEGEGEERLQCPLRAHLLSLQCPPPLSQQCSPSVPPGARQRPCRAMEPPQPLPHPGMAWTCPQPGPFPSLPQRDLQRGNRAELKEGHLKAPSPNWAVPSPKLEPPSPAQPPAEQEMLAPPSPGPAAKLNKTNQTAHFTQ